MRFGKTAAVILAALVCGIVSGGCASETADSVRPLLPKSEHARLLRLQTSDPHFTIAEIISASDSIRVAERYLLFNTQADKAVRDSLSRIFPGAQTFDAPLRNMLVYSSVQGRAFVELGVSEAVGGIVDSQYFNVPELAEAIASGKITDCGAASSPSKEKILAMHPDAILLSLYEGMDVGGVDKLGIPVVKLVDNLEATPLGRAEWLRFLGALTGRQAEADSIFACVKENYNRIKTESSALSRRPKILTDNIYQGVWYLPAGESFASRLIADAGGDYPWKDTKGNGSLACSFEEVIGKAKDAEVWLIRLFDKDLTLSSLEKEDSRYSAFEAFENGNVWFANSAETPVFEDATYHPDRLLADYARIFRIIAAKEAGKGKTEETRSEATGSDSLLYFKKIGR